jgi:hypothetical protein
MVVKALPKWAMERYAKLWNKFKDKEFEYEDVVKTLKEKNEKIISVFLSYLKKYGWLTIKLHPEDSRKRIYQLKNPEKAIHEIGRVM